MRLDAPPLPAVLLLLLPLACGAQAGLPDGPQPAGEQAQGTSVPAVSPEQSSSQGSQPGSTGPQQAAPTAGPAVAPATAVPTAASSVTVTATAHDIATAEVRLEEKQRVLGIIPNFYVVYAPNPVPLSPGQKFSLAWRSTLDPVNLLGTAFIAGVQQSGDQFSGYGQGSAGYARRFGANFADGAIGTFLGGALLPTLFHQDPRYYYQGTGSVKSRTWHAVSSVILCRGDNGRLQFNASNVLGSFGAAGLSNLYYPASDRNGAGLTLGNASTGLAFGAFAAVMQEFVVKKLTPHLPNYRGAAAK